MRVIAIPLLLLATVLSGCRSAVDEYTASHIVAIKSDGNPYPYPVEKDGKVTSADKFCYQVRVNNVIDAIKASGRKKILLFAFGGMNSIDWTIDRSEVLAKAIESDSGYYPVFINWESSLFDAYYEHLMFIRRGYFSYVYGPALSPFYFVSDLGRAGTRLPIDLVYQSGGIIWENYITEYVDNRTYRRYRKKGYKIFIGKDLTSHTKRFCINSVYAMGFPVRVLTTPVINACGKSAWDVMDRRTHCLFEKDITFKQQRRETEMLELRPPDGALSLFMNALRKLQKEDGEYSVTLIGHSMGGLIINLLLQRYYDVKYDNIVFLASASPVGTTMASVIPYLLNNPEARFYNLCLHPNADLYNPMSLVGLPRGSILTWLDLYFANTITPTDNCVGLWTNIVPQLSSLPPEVRPRFIVKAFGINDPMTNTIKLNMPESHTDFSDPALKFWKESFWKIPREVKK